MAMSTRYALVMSAIIVAGIIAVSVSDFSILTFAEQQQNFTAKLTGTKEVPTKSNIKATGNAEFLPNADKGDILNRLKLLGEPVIKLDCIGGISVIAVAIRKKEEEKIQSLSDILKPAIIQNYFISQYSPTRHNLLETDFKILKCLISNPRMEISEIARKTSASSKTVSSRLEKMKENKILHFIVRTGPARMQGYVRFAMLIRMDRKGSQKSIRQIQEELEKDFVIAFPVIIQEGVTVWQLVARNVFEVDSALKKIELLEGVEGVNVYIPFRVEHYPFDMGEIYSITRRTKE